jgi:hypothetical protein
VADFPRTSVRNGPCSVVSGPAVPSEKQVEENTEKATEESDESPENRTLRAVLGGVSENPDCPNDSDDHYRECE